MYVCMYVCMYVDMSFPQMRHCNIAPLRQLCFCRNNVTADNTFPTCFGVGQVGIQNKWNIDADADTIQGANSTLQVAGLICTYVHMHVCMYVTVNIFKQREHYASGLTTFKRRGAGMHSVLSHIGRSWQAKRLPVGQYFPYSWHMNVDECNSCWIFFM